MKIRNLITSIIMTTGLFAQSVVGVVTDVDSKPLVGANVIVEGTESGGVTDGEGKFTIETGPGTFDITASFIGYVSHTKSLSVSDIVSTLSFALATDVVALSALEVLAQERTKQPPLHTLM